MGSGLARKAGSLSPRDRGEGKKASEGEASASRGPGRQGPLAQGNGQAGAGSLWALGLSERTSPSII